MPGRDLDLLGRMHQAKAVVDLIRKGQTRE